jgi:hypothetical protein
MRVLVLEDESRRGLNGVIGTAGVRFASTMTGFSAIRPGLPTPLFEGWTTWFLARMCKGFAHTAIAVTTATPF